MTAASWMLRQMGFVSTLDALLPWDPKQCKLSPGTRLLALTLCVLFDRAALCNVQQVLARQDLSIPFGSAPQAADFNDDALGRALDKLARARPARVFHTVAAQVWAHERVPFDTLHGDTTAVALYGSYPAPEPELLQIVPGFSKEHRPDLRQVGLGLVSGPEGIPLLADVHDGNLSDNAWNGTIIAELARVLPEQTLRAILYTADCKLVTPNNLRALHDTGLHWLSRLPETYDLATTLKQRAWAGGSWDAPAPLSPRRSLPALRVRGRGPQRRPPASPGRSALSLHRGALHGPAGPCLLIAEETAAVHQALTAAPSFPTAEQADAAAAALLSKLTLRYHTLQLATAPITLPGKRPTRGRPPKGAPPPPPVTRFIWNANLRPADATDLQREIEDRSCFLLITDEPRRSARELLAVYKRQQTAVEIPFHRTKALPVAPMFLERPERVRAMGYVLLMAYVAFAVMQRRVRHALAARGQDLPTYDHHRSATPTGQVLLQHLAAIHTDIQQENGHPVRVLKFPGVARQVLDLLGVPMEAYVTQHDATY